MKKVFIVLIILFFPLRVYAEKINNKIAEDEN